MALGWDAVFLLPGCADPYNDKSIRASRGACFKLPIQRGTMEEWMEVSARHGLTPIAAELDRRKGGNGSNGAGNGAAEEALGAVAGARVSLVLGSEGQGVSREMLEMCTPVAISMLGDMESLNVAAAGSIFMWALSPGAPMLLAELGAALGPQGAGAAAGSFGK